MTTDPLQQPLTRERNGQMRDVVNVTAGFGMFMVEAPRGSLVAQTRMRMPRRPADPSDEIWINMGAGGIGDSLLGLCAVKGYKRANPDRYIVYRVNEFAQPFVAMFDGGYDGLCYHAFDEVFGNFPKGGDARDLQMNLGYKEELTGRAQITRLERYCRNLGWVTPEMPTLRDPEMKSLAKTKADVVLFPFSTRGDRDYPLHGWLTIENSLAKAGFEVLVVGATPPAHAAKVNRTDLFKSRVVMDPKPEILASIMMNARCVIGNDSGPAHLACLLGRPTIVLCGWSVGDRVFSFYPTVRCLQGVMGCNGCWTETPEYEHARCGVMCANLASIDPARVMREVLTRVVRHVS